MPGVKLLCLFTRTKFASLTERKKTTRKCLTLNVHLNSVSSEDMAKIKTAYFS